MSTFDQIPVPDDERDFVQLGRGFDRPVAPAPSFATRLRAEVVHEAAARPEPVRQPAAPVPPSRPAAAPPARLLRRRAGATALEIAATLLLVSALAASAFVIYALGSPIERDDARQTSIAGTQSSVAAMQDGATPDSGEASTGHVNYGGDEGRSQYYGDTSVNADAAPVELQIGDERTITVGPGLIAGGSWYGWTVRDGADAFLRVDVETGEQVWSRPYRIWGTLAADGERIYAFLIDTSDTPTPVPVAIDMESGEIAWRGPALNPFAISFVADNLSAPRDERATPVSGPGATPSAQPAEGERFCIDLTADEHGPVVAGETVYFTDGRATTVALSTADGAERWRDDRSDQFPPVVGNDNEIQRPRWGTVIANERHVLVRLPDNSIVSLDPATGEEIGRSYTGGINDSTRIILSAALRGDRLIVVSASSIVSDDQEWRLQSAAVSVLDAGTLDVLVTSDVIERTADFELVATDTSAFVRTIDEQEVPALVEIDLATGAISEPFGAGLLAGEVRLSGAGDTLIAATSIGTVLYFSMETHDLVERHGVAREQPAWLVGGPMAVVDGRPVAIFKIGPNAPFPETPPATPLP